MKPVDMVHLEHGEEGATPGDCMRACIASLLELPSSAVPHFCDHPEPDVYWVKRTQDWLSSVGYWFVEIPRVVEWRGRRTHGIDWYLLPRSITPLVMAGGKSPRGEWGHWVIGSLTRDGFDLVHDPHPSRAGLDGDPEDYGLLVRYDRVRGGESEG